jgi:hypothetical protein
VVMKNDAMEEQVRAVIELMKEIGRLKSYLTP